MTLALNIQGLRKKYHTGVEALKGIDLQVQPGNFFGLLGPNGAGKSTTIGIISSLVRKTQGTVSIFGTDIDQDLEKAKSYLGLVPQEFNFNQFEKVFDILIHQAGFYGISRKTAVPKVEHYLQKLGLWEKRNNIARSLSGGMKRRLMIARALVHEPKMLILDEPTAGVDIEIRRHMWQFLQEINQQGTTIILTTHYLEEAEHLCRDLAIIDQGRIVENTSVKQLLSTLNQEQFVLDLQSPWTQALPVIPGLALQQPDPLTLEANIDKTLSLNEVFRQLSEQGLQVASMRNKENRLEALFLERVQRSSNIDSDNQYPKESETSHNA